MVKSVEIENLVLKGRLDEVDRLYREKKVSRASLKKAAGNLSDTANMATVFGFRAWVSGLSDDPRDKFVRVGDTRRYKSQVSHGKKKNGQRGAPSYPHGKIPLQTLGVSGPGEYVVASFSGDYVIVTRPELAGHIKVEIVPEVVDQVAAMIAARPTSEDEGDDEGEDGQTEGGAAEPESPATQASAAA